MFCYLLNYIMDRSNFGIIGKNSIVTDHGNVRPSNIKIGDKIISGSGFNKIVFSEVKNIIKRKYNDIIIEVTTTSNNKIFLSKDQLVFSKFDVKNKYYFVYLAQINDGYYIGISKNQIMVEKKYFDPYHYWIIDVFQKEEDAVYFQYFVAYTFGIPAYEKNSSWNKMSLERIKNIFNNLNTLDRAVKLMKEYFIVPDYFYRCPAPSNISGILNLIFYGGPDYNPATSSYKHRVLVNKTTSSIRESVSRVGRNNKKNLWIVDASKKNRSEILELSKTLSTLENLEIIQYCQLTDTAPFFIMPATHLKKGMYLSILDTDKICEEIIESVAILEPFSTNSYKFEFDEEYNNLVVNNIFIHN